MEELFYTLPWSHGTHGILVAVTKLPLAAPCVQDTKFIVENSETRRPVHGDGARLSCSVQAPIAWKCLAGNATKAVCSLRELVLAGGEKACWHESALRVCKLQQNPRIVDRAHARDVVGNPFPQEPAAKMQSKLRLRFASFQ